MTTARVLIVEDDADIREAVVDILQGAGYTVLEASDGKVALERLRSHPEALVVLLDLLMPMMGGFEVLQAAAEEPPLLARHAYIICAATRRIPPPPVAALIEQHQIPFLQKPFDIDELPAAVQKAASTLD